MTSVSPPTCFSRLRKPRVTNCSNKVAIQNCTVVNQGRLPRRYCPTGETFCGRNGERSQRATRFKILRRRAGKSQSWNKSPLGINFVAFARGDTQLHDAMQRRSIIPFLHFSLSPPPSQPF